MELRKLLTPEQFGPGLVSTSCISLEDTSAVLTDRLADKLTAVRAAAAKAVRNTARFDIACPVLYSSFVMSKMDKTLKATKNWKTLFVRTFTKVPTPLFFFVDDLRAAAFQFPTLARHISKVVPMISFPNELI